MKSEPAVIIGLIAAALVAVVQAVAGNIDDPGWQNAVLAIVPIITALAGLITRRFVSPTDEEQVDEPDVEPLDGRYDP